MTDETKTCGCVLQTVVQFHDKFGKYLGEKIYTGWNFSDGDEIHRDGKLYRVNRIIIDDDEMTVKIRAYLWE